ncbi:MAG: hypothetical protein AAGI22_07045 [Planctomycetota bacterium]
MLKPAASSLAASLVPLVALTHSALAQWAPPVSIHPGIAPVVVAVGDTVLIAGGITSISTSGPGCTAEVAVYRDGPGTWTTEWLQYARCGHAAAVVGSRAIFVGDHDLTPYGFADVYDDSTQTWSVMPALSVPRTHLSATSVGDIALFAGGLDRLGMPSDVVELYDDATGTWSRATLSQEGIIPVAASVGSKALFANPFGTTSDVVDIYDASVGQWSTATLQVPHSSTAATTLGSRVYFAGDASGAVDIYDDSTGQWSTVTWPQTAECVTATTLGTKLLFALRAHPTVIVNTYDTATGQWTSDACPVPSIAIDSATVGTSALFSGGLAVHRYDDAIGVTYCAPAVANSTGGPARLTAQGFPGTVAQGYALLRAVDLPPQTTGYFLNSRDPPFVVGPGGSQGNLCLGGSIGRYSSTPFDSGTSGTASLQLDLASTPTPLGAVSIVAGETWNFQAWYRDANPGPTTNFTDAVSVILQ